jgi:hypothetical protein
MKRTRTVYHVSTGTTITHDPKIYKKKETETTITLEAGTYRYIIMKDQIVWIQENDLDE